MCEGECVEAGEEVMSQYYFECGSVTTATTPAQPKFRPVQLLMLHKLT